MNNLAYVRLDYCMYGSLYRETARIWTHAVWEPKMCDRSHVVDYKHAKTAQRGGRGTWNSHDTFDRGQLHAPSNALCDEIVEVCRQTVSVNQCDFTSETNYLRPLEVVTKYLHSIWNPGRIL